MNKPFFLSALTSEEIRGFIQGGDGVTMRRENVVAICKWALGVELSIREQEIDIINHGDTAPEDMRDRIKELEDECKEAAEDIPF